jgi:hypothetical protein
MSSRFSRWTLLIIFSACNLLFWVAVAAATGLLVSREVDLGVETLIRERQATAVVVWKRVVSRPSEVTGTPSMPAQEPAQEPMQADAKAKMEMPMTPAILPPEPTQSPTPPVQATQQVAAASNSTPPPLETPIPQPEQAWVSSPLLLSDVEFGNFAQVDKEMGRSAIGRAVQIRYDEATLNSEIATLLENKPDLPYRDVQIDLKHDGVIVAGDVTVLGFTVSTEVEGAVVAKDCLPRMQINSTSVAGVLTPGFVKERIEQMLLDALNWYPVDHPLCLQQIVLEEDRATVYGYRR